MNIDAQKMQDIIIDVTKGKETRLKMRMNIPFSKILLTRIFNFIYKAA